jgi:YidC/Oxa1 family membrane protein insertase
LSSQNIVRRAATSAAGTQPATIIRLMRFIPYGTIVVAAVAPVAMSLYLLASTAWTVGEQRLLPRIVPA